jgi:selenocysteine-specific elongation factor
MPLVFGTAGHIDHGKSTLVTHLTGIDPDRLKEEKARGITIELGFAYLDLPGLGRVSIIDVPGHERFVRHMVAGAQGIDAVIIVVAADEGVMPQTREHIDICRLLGVKSGVIALTKADLVDEDFLALAIEDVRQITKGTFLEGAKIIPVAAPKQMGLEALKEELVDLGKKLPARSGEGVARLPIDRVFTLTGFGTVVTGTMLGGRFRVGDPIEVHALTERGPITLEAKIRSLQVHNESTNEVCGGQRAAICVAGIERQDVERGATIATPGVLRATQELDVKLYYVGHTKKNLTDRADALLHLSTAQARARVLLLDTKEVSPGGEALARLRLDRPIVTLPGERFILRGSEEMTGHGKTIGGGEVLDAKPLQQKKRALLSASVLPIAEAIESGSSERLALAHIERAKEAGLSLSVLVGLTGIAAKPLEKLLNELGAKKLAKRFDVEGQRYVSQKELTSLSAQLLNAVEAYHSLYPMRPGIPKEELRTRLSESVPVKLFARLLEDLTKANELEPANEVIKKKGFTPKVGDASKIVALLKTIYAEAARTPPRLPELESLLSIRGEKASQAVINESLHMLRNEKILVKVSDDLWFDASVLIALKEQLIAYLKERGHLSPQEWKDLVGATRKYTIPLAEYFDGEKVTLRVGDERRLR